MFKAKWNTIEYTILYEGVDGASFPSSAINTYTIDDPDYIVPIPKKDGYGFIGWTVKNTTYNPLTLTPSFVTSNATKSNDRYVLTLTATWSNAIEYAITYDMNGHGSVPNNFPKSYNVNSPTIMFLTNPTGDDGYTFLGWFPPTIPHGSTGDKTITAVWRSDTHSIKYVYGSDDDQVKDIIDEMVSSGLLKTSYTQADLPYTPANPKSYDDWTFDGWYDANGQPYSTI